MRKKTLIVMVKEPLPGRVKSRLGRDIGMTTAAWWFRNQVKDMLRRLQDPRWELVLAVTPDYAGLKSRVWPNKHRRLKQGGGDLGARMARVLASVPHGPVCVIGADIPGVTKMHIAKAFAVLKRTLKSESLSKGVKSGIACIVSNSPKTSVTFERTLES